MDGVIPITYHAVEKLEAVEALVYTIAHRWQDKLDLYLDVFVDDEVETEDKSITFLKIFVDRPFTKNIYMVNVKALEHAAFETPFSGHRESAMSSDRIFTLRTVLESTLFTKFVFNCETISYLLFKQFHIRMHAVREVQLMECALRAELAVDWGTGEGRDANLHTFETCIQKHSHLFPFTGLQETNGALVNSVSMADASVVSLDFAVDFNKDLRDLRMLYMLYDAWASYYGAIFQYQCDLETQHRVERTWDPDYVPFQPNLRSPWSEPYEHWNETHEL